MIENALAKDIHALQPRLTRQGYDAKVLAELLNAKPRDRGAASNNWQRAGNGLDIVILGFTIGGDASRVLSSPAAWRVTPFDALLYLAEITHRLGCDHTGYTIALEPPIEPRIYALLEIQAARGDGPKSESFGRFCPRNSFKTSGMIEQLLSVAKLSGNKPQASNLLPICCQFSIRKRAFLFSSGSCFEGGKFLEGEFWFSSPVRQTTLRLF